MRTREVAAFAQGESSEGAGGKRGPDGSGGAAQAETKSKTGGGGSAATPDMDASVEHLPAEEGGRGRVGGGQGGGKDASASEDVSGDSITASQQAASAVAASAPNSEHLARDTGDKLFSSQHLVCVLTTLSKDDMTTLVSALRNHGDAFNEVKLSVRVQGASRNLTKREIAESIASCRPEAVMDAEGLLRWLVGKRLLKNPDLHKAMDALKPAISYIQRDTTEVLMSKIVEAMRTREVSASAEGESSEGAGVKRGPDGSGGAAQAEKKSKTVEHNSERGGGMPAGVGGQGAAAGAGNDCSGGEGKHRGDGSGECATTGELHLADMLTAACPTLKSMKDFLRELQKKDNTFMKVKLSSCTSEQMALTIAKCRPDQVTNAEELVSWLMVSCMIVVLA